MATTPTGTNLNGYEVKYWNRQTEADGDIMSQQTIMPMCSAIQANRDDIDTMKAATDVINVYGTYSAFESESGEMVEAGYLTDYDIVKVLQDEEHDDMQTYWQCHKEGDIWTWDYVGDLAPYYSKSDINSFSASLSGTISSNYYASGNVTTAGKNLSATQTAVNGAPKVEISIKDKVEFVTVSASDGFSGTNISGDGKNASIKNLIISAEGGSAANAWLNNNTIGDSVKYALSSEKVKWEKGTDNKYRPIGFANAEQEAQWNAGNAFYDEIVYDSAFNYNPVTDTLSSINYTCTNITGTTAKFTGFSGTNISASDGSTTATIKNLINSAEGGSAANAWITDYTTDNSANSAINATNADHTKDVITSYYATESQAGTQTSTFNVSSLKLSGNKTAGVEISKTTNNNVDYLYFKLNSDTVCNYVEDQNKYVKYTDTSLNIGDINNLGVTGAATALCKYASASNYSYIINFGENSQLSSYATNKGFAVGDSNYAVYNSYVIGWGNSADNLGDSNNQNRFILGLSNSSNASNTFTIGLRNKTSMNNSFIMGIGNNLSNNTTLPYKIILGAYSQSTAQSNSNLFAIGNGTSTKSKDIFSLSNNYLTFNTEDYITRISSAGIQFTIPDGTSNPPIAKTIPNKYIQGLSFLEPEYCNSAAADINGDICLIFGDNASAASAPNTGADFSANRISLYFDTSCPSKRFRLYPTIASAYSLCIGLNSKIKDIYIRGFGLIRYPGDGVDPMTGAGIDNVYFIASSWANIGWPGLREGYAPNTTNATAIYADNYYYNATNSTYLYIRRIALNRYIDITYDRVANAFVMIKGFESSKLCYPETD